MFISEIQSRCAMLAIIGGTGLSELEGFEQLEKVAVKTSYGLVKVRLVRIGSGDKEFIFLPRHGAGHKIPPHKINYRANIAALSDLGVTAIVAINAVGAIHGDFLPGSVAVPDQLIDYSYSRDVSFFDGKLKIVHHIDFTNPYSEPIRQRILEAMESVNFHSKTDFKVMAGGTYACTQ